MNNLFVNSLIIGKIVSNNSDHLWENIQPKLLENDFEIVERLFLVYGIEAWKSVTLTRLYQMHRKRFVLQIVRKDGLALKDVSDFNADRQVALEAIKNNPKAINFVNKELIKDREFILESVRNNGMILTLLKNQYQKDREVALAAISNSASVFTIAKQKFTNNRNFVIDAVKENGKVMELVNSKLYRDRELILLALHQISNCKSNENQSMKQVALTCVKEGACSIVLRLNEFVNDIEIIMESIKRSGLKWNVITNEQEAILLINKMFEIMNLLSNNFKNEKSIIGELLFQTLEIVSFAERGKLANSGLCASLTSCINNLIDETNVLTVVRNCGCSLQFASLELQNDREIVLEAVRNDPKVFQFLDETLRNDKELILEAVKTDFFSIPNDLKYKFRNDRDFILEAVNYSIIPLKHTCDSIKDDLEIMKIAIKKDPNVIELASERLRNCKEIAMEVVNLNGELLKFLSLEMQNDRQVVMTAIRNMANSIQFASSELMKDKSCILEAIRNGLKCKFFINHQDIITMDLEMFMEAVKRDESGTIAIIKHLLPNELKEELVIQSGFCCEFSEDLFQKRLKHAYHDASFLE